MDMENHYELTGFNPTGICKEKTRIIMGNTNRDYKNYINGLRYRYNKKNPYLPNYVITREGDIYEIISPDYYSKYMENETLDKESIIIVLENFGWLKKNPLESIYTNWIGDIYKKEIFEKRWRDEIFWETYNIKQIKSLANLLNSVCEKYKIPKVMVESNVLYDEVKNFKGITSKSNYDVIYKDVNPSFDFKLLKNLLEND
jgi:hypothetical protein